MSLQFPSFRLYCLSWCAAGAVAASEPSCLPLKSFSSSNPSCSAPAGPPAEPDPPSLIPSSLVTWCSSGLEPASIGRLPSSSWVRSETIGESLGLSYGHTGAVAGKPGTPTGRLKSSVSDTHRSPSLEWISAGGHTARSVQCLQVKEKKRLETYYSLDVAVLTDYLSSTVARGVDSLGRSPPVLAVIPDVA